MKILCYKAVLTSGPSGIISDYLSVKTGLSKSKIKDSMNKGAVWLKKRNGPLRRIRRASTTLFPGDYVEFYYHEKTLALSPPSARCLNDLKQYSVWFKPAGLLAQGTRFGDHCSLIRQAELFFRPSREAFLVHRLDREAAGIMLLAHTKEAAARLSGLFHNNLIVKKYHVEVLGDLRRRGLTGTIDLPLGGKPCLTEFTITIYHPETNTTEADVIIRTGRFHQIRRHFDMIGFPIIGDPRYGSGNKNSDGMKLSAISLSFRCPFLGKEVEYLTGEPGIAETQQKKSP